MNAERLLEIATEGSKKRFVLFEFNPPYAQRWRAWAKATLNCAKQPVLGEQEAEATAVEDEFDADIGAIGELSEASDDGMSDADFELQKLETGGT